MLDIRWSSEGTDYCIQYSHMRVNGNWNYAATAFYTLPLENKTYELTIALHPVMNMASNFTIGKYRTTLAKNSNIWLNIVCIINNHYFPFFLISTIHFAKTSGKKTFVSVARDWDTYEHAYKSINHSKDLLTVWNIQTQANPLARICCADATLFIKTTWPVITILTKNWQWYGK